MKYFPVIGMLGCLSLPLPGQATGNPVLSGWEGSNLCWVRLRANSELVEETPGRTKTIEKRTPLPPGEGRVTLSRDEAYTYISGPQGQDGSFMSRKKGGRWQLVGSVPRNLPIHRIYPLGGGKMILEAIGGKFFTKDEKAASPYATAVWDDSGALKVVDLVDLGFSKGLIQKAPPDPEKTGKSDTPNFRINRDYSFLLRQQYYAFNTFFPSGEGGALLFHWPGYICLLDGKGQVRKKVKIYSEFGEDQVKNLLQFEPVIIGAAWKPDGRLLLAVREKEGVFTSHQIYPSFDAKGIVGPPAESLGNVQKRLENFPGIKWYELDPESGSLEALENTPPGAPSEFSGNLRPDKFGFLVRPNGSVRLMD